MLRRILTGIILTLATMVTLVGISPLVAAPAHAACDPNVLTAQSGIDCAKSSSTPSKGLFSPGGLFATIANILIFIVGAVAVLMIIVGGLRYVLSAGNSKAVNDAKDSILYAVIGLAVAVLAYAIVHFVLTRLGVR